jgi:hypothetical protein
MDIKFTGLENVPTYLAIIVATSVFSFFSWKILFLELDAHEIKYTKKIKRRSLWLIFFNLLSLIVWWRIFQLLLSRLQ